MKTGYDVLRKSYDAGLRITAALTGASYLAYLAGEEKLAIVLFWPYGLLQYFFPSACFGFSAQAHCQTTTTNLLVFFGSILLSLAFYSTLAYVVLLSRMRSGA